MAAGLGFKTFTTGEVLTAADTNGYLMQGILVFASAAARDAAITSPQEGQACYLKDTNEVLTYSGSAWVAVGGSGGMTLISTTTLTGATTTVGSIPGTYNSLFGLVYGVTNATANGYMKMQANAADNATSTATEGTVVGGDATRVFLNPDSVLLRTDANNVWSFNIDNYASATNYKSVYWTGVFVNGSSVNKAVVGGGGFRTNTAITSLVFNNSGGNLSTGTVLLYGVK